jgi:hypothetical protein
MPRAKREHGRFTLFLSTDRQGEPEVCCIDHHGGPDDVIESFHSLVETWIAIESVDGELHPYLDGTLNMLACFNWAQRKIISRLEDGDPVGDDLRPLLDRAADILREVMDRLGAEDERG